MLADIHASNGIRTCIPALELDKAVYALDHTAIGIGKRRMSHVQ